MREGYSQRDYYNDVRGIAEHIRTLKEKDDARDGGEYFDVSDAIHEAVDGSEWVIYPSNARLVIEYSENDGAIFEQMGPQTWEDWSAVFVQSAYFAMCADVYEALTTLPEKEDEPDSFAALGAKVFLSL